MHRQVLIASNKIAQSHLVTPAMMTAMQTLILENRGKLCPLGSSNLPHFSGTHSSDLEQFCRKIVGFFFGGGVGWVGVIQETDNKSNPILPGMEL